jgi:superfamily II DNA or RNA helicase
MSSSKIHVQINNRTALLLRPYDYEKLLSYWSFSVPNFKFITRRFPGWDGKIKLLKRDRLPAGLFWATYTDIEKNEHIKFKLELQSQRINIFKFGLKSEGKYDFQNKCVAEMEEALHRGHGGLILNATGSGKTRIAAMLASRLDCEILFIVDQLVLLRQAQSEIAKHLGEKVGYVGESKFKLERVTVATIQTLHLHRADPKFLNWFKRVQVIIVDEIHEAMNKSNFDVVKIAEPLCTFGLTATLALSQKPIRLKAYSLTGPIIYEYPVQRGMQEGVLSKGVCIQLKYENSLDNIAGWDSSEAYTKRIIENGERNTLISRLVKKAVKLGKYTIVYIERLKHIEEIADRLTVPYKVVSGTYKGKSIKVDDRLKSKDKFEAGKVRVILANKVLKKGVDIKRVDVIINAAAKPNTNDVIQIFGRGVRTHKDKTGLICFDISDVDKLDKDRSKKNWLHIASKKRMRALKKAGITVKPFIVTEDSKTKDIYQYAEKVLLKEINK